MTAWRAGEQLGPYELIGAIGAGGMGEVWKARDTRLGRVVAIKRLKSEHAERFQREARAIAALNHPHICQIYDAGVDYLVMEHVEGKPLKGPLLVDDAVRLAIQIAGALEEAHSKGIIHRDLKPGNILITRKGEAKLLDFGLAKLEEPGPRGDTFSTLTVGLTEAGVVVGTVAYMSPEQAQGLAVDTRSDIFSFGLVLYEMLSGKRAFSGDTPMATLAAIVKDEPAPLAAPEALERIVRRCLAKQATQRFQTMAEVRKALEQAGQAGSVSQQQPSIAVLPFANMSADKENEYFGDGLAEEIINVLANVPGMKVTARTSSFFFRGKDVEFGEIGRRLNVEHILEGSVRRAGNRIRVTAQLIKAADGFHVWSERYDRELTDIFAIQDEITRAIAAALQMKLSPEPAAQRHVPALRAYEAYLKARDLWFNGARPELLPRFKELLERAIELDPKFALAHSFLGIYYTMQASLSLKLAREVVPLALAAEQAALRVDPSLAEAHAILAVCIGGYEYDWAGAERHWRLAMAREPASRDIRFWYGNHHLLPIGRTAEAVEAMEWGLQGDPLNLMYRWLLARGLRLAGRLDDVEAELRAVLEIDENYPHALATLGSICAQQGRFEEALTVTRKANAVMPWSNPVIGQLAALLVRTGAASQADHLIEKLGPGTAPGAASGLVIFHAVCGDLDRAAKWAELAIEQRDMPFVQNLGPFLQPTPWWPALAKLMNLPETAAA
ncbi:MAG: protein kinase [Acidobacteriia bacterium]|nr:protein kinase [Terriglobia bacterium]